MSYKTIAIKAARTAGIELLYLSKKVRPYVMKNSHDILAEADVRAEHIILSMLGKSFPDHSILSEEVGVNEKKSPYQWIVDPLDGTISFVRGIEEYCVSIGLLYKHKPILGVVYQPYGDKMYYAEKGTGAYMNNKKIQVSKTDTLIASILTSDNGQDIPARQQNFNLLARMCTKVRHTRIFGSSALHLAKIAEGKTDIYMKSVFNYWDIAAGHVLITEAGGKVTDLNGRIVTKDSIGIIASNGRVHSEYVRAVVVEGGTKTIIEA